MSTTNNKRDASGSRHSVGTVGLVVAAGVELLAGRIEQLEAEERAAVKKGDWPAARSAVVEKAALKEAQHRAAAGSRRGRA